MTITEPAEHEIGGLGAEGEHRLARFESGSQLRQSEPDGGRSRISQPICRDHNPLTRDAEGRRQNGIHSAIGLMRQDVVAGRVSRVFRRSGAMQKQFAAGMADRGEIVLEFGESETAARGVGAALRYGKAIHTPASHLPVKYLRESRTRAVIIAREDDRGRPVAHLDEIDQLTCILRRPVRVKKHGARFGPNDRHRPRSPAQQSLREHQSVGKPGAGLAKFDEGAVVIQQLRNLADVWRYQVGRCRGVADEIEKISRRQAGFAERTPYRAGSEFGIAMPFARRFQAPSHVAAQVARADPEPVSDCQPCAA